MNELFSFYLMGVWVALDLQFGFHVELLQSGLQMYHEIPPMIFVRIGFVYLWFENKRLYDWLYKKKFN